MPALQIGPEAYQIPCKIGSVPVKRMDWSLFKGTPPENTWFLSYIYWNVSYTIQQMGSRRGQNASENNNDDLYDGLAAACYINAPYYVRSQSNVAPKSWIRAPQDSDLMTHEYGHYLISCLSAIEFVKRVNHQVLKPNKTEFRDFCKQTLQQCQREYQKWQTQYDKDSYHYLDREGQMNWQKKIKDKFLEYERYFKTLKPIPGKVVQLSNPPASRIINQRGVTMNKNTRIASKNQIEPAKRGLTVQRTSLVNRPPLTTNNSNTLNNLPSLSKPLKSTLIAATPNNPARVSLTKPPSTNQSNNDNGNKQVTFRLSHAVNRRIVGSYAEAEKL